MEAGTHNMPGVAGLAEGVRFVLDRTPAAILAHERALAGRLIEGLAGDDRVAVHGPADPVRRVGTVSVAIGEVPPDEVGSILDVEYDIAVRTGLHCAPLAHRWLGTFPLGSVRLSVGPFNTAGDIDAAIEALRAVAGSEV
jgi:selenocysteine lyase/cysteine desulfurase